MIYKISRSNKKTEGKIILPSSKSISNRLLIIRALINENITIKNLSTAHDTILLAEILQKLDKYNGKSLLKINIGNTGTVMRFLTACLAVKNGRFYLYGSKRMSQRPISHLVSSLLSLKADIQYPDKIGFPPLLIKGKKIFGGEVEVESGISSQFVTALILIAPLLEKGLEIKLKGKIVSQPYIEMTLNLLKEFQVENTIKDNIISIKHQQYKIKDYFVESDWSSASYWYEIAALSENANIELPRLYKNSIQGDSVIAKIFEEFGVHTTYTKEGVVLSKTDRKINYFSFDFSNYPDLVPAVAVTCAALKINCLLKGLDNLIYKESNRILSIQNELSGLGFDVEIINNNSLKINKSDIKADYTIKTWEDHRIAMAFAPLALIDDISIENTEVVTKSYPGFWNDLEKAGFICKE